MVCAPFDGDMTFFETLSIELLGNSNGGVSMIYITGRNGHVVSICVFLLLEFHRP